MNTVFTDTWGGGSFKLSVNFTYIGQPNPQQGQSSETFKGPVLNKGFNSSPQLFLQSWSLSMLGAKRDPRNQTAVLGLCWGSIQVPVFFAGLLQGVREENLALTCKWQRLPSWSWSCQCENERRYPVHRKDFHPRLPGSWQPEVAVSSGVQRTCEPWGGSALLHPE